ncbi:MAG: hypothetical protein J0L61_13440 [Planctomycetes bacterium]|nr:hypothetical protein [Planctomycetota bacterium]
MRRTVALPALLLLVACAFSMLQTGAAARPALSDEQIAQQCADKIVAATQKPRAAIIRTGESTVTKVNQQQARNTRPATVTKTATSGVRTIEKTLASGKRTLESLALTGVRTLNRRGASTHLNDQINATKADCIGVLEMTAQDCFNAIDTALND